MTMLRASPWWMLAGAALAVPAGLWLLWNFDPNAADSRYPPCMFRAFTGWFCIGCGLTRALHALAHGDIARAFALNPLAMLAMAAVPLLVAQAQGWQPQRLQPLMRVVGEPKLWLVLLPAYWIARNLPWFPFTLLAPG